MLGLTVQKYVIKLWRSDNTTKTLSNLNEQQVSEHLKQYSRVKGWAALVYQADHLKDPGLMREDWALGIRKSFIRPRPQP